MSESTTPMPISGEAATTRLARLLTMVPWLMGRQGIDIEQAARTLGVSRKQIEAALGHRPPHGRQATLVLGHRKGQLRLGQAQLVHADECPQLRPRDRPIPGMSANR